jgi:elongation factor G
MAEFDSSHVKNIVLLGHAGSGKTTLAECMLYEAGLINRRGSVEQQSTMSDYHDLEKEKGHSVFSKLLHTKWLGYKINIIDTPGYDDFSGEIITALRVADTGVMLLNASYGVEVGADIIWQYTEHFKTPMIFAINQLDHEKADFDKTIREAKSHFGTNVVLVQYPLHQGPAFNTVVDLLHMVLYKFPGDGGKPEKLPIPDAEKERAEQLHKELIEAIASNDEGLMEKYFDQGELTEDEMKIGLKKSMIRHDLFPVFCVSGKNDMGVGRLLGYIDNICPSATEMPPQTTKEGDVLTCDENGQACIFVFKTVSESHIGDMSLFKVYSGKVKAGMELVNENTGVTEKINQLFVLEGNKRIPVDELVAGDIGATLKLKNTHANNTLHEKGKNIDLAPIEFPTPIMSIAIESSKKGEEEKLAQALHQLKEEDPSVLVEVSPELKQTILHCQGDMHLAVIKWKLEHNHGLDVKFIRPKIPYRETICKMAEAVYRHKKQSGGAGQFGEVSIRIEPWFDGMPEPAGLNVRGRETHDLPWGGKLVYYNCIVGGAIEARFLPSVLKGVMEKMHEGPLTGSYARDIRVCLFDGKMHPVDSNDLAFKIAGLKAFKDAFKNASPLILEPIYTITVLTPEDLTGSVIGDLQTRRAIVEGIDAEGSFSKVIAKVPLAEMHDYSSSLRSITQGRAKFKMEIADYLPVPGELQKKLIEDYNKVAQEEFA